MLIVDLVTQIENFTINLGLELIAPDDFDDILCVRLQLDHARLLSLRIHRNGGDCQNRNSRHQVHGGSPRGFPLVAEQQSCQRGRNRCNAPGYWGGYGWGGYGRWRAGYWWR